VVRRSWVPLTATASTFTLPGPTSSMDFYAINIGEGSSHLLDILVTSGVGVQVEVYPKDCSLRYDTFSMWCFLNQDCQIPLPTRGNFGSFFQTTDSVNSLWTDTDLRIVIYGRDTTYSIKYLTGQESCSTINSFITPFCDAVQSQSGRGAWGTTTTFPEKDDYAVYFYNQLYTAFSCLKNSGCACRKLTVPCEDKLKAYACETALPQCSSSGSFAIPQKYSLCEDVERECEASFEQAGLPQHGCEHNYYIDGVLFTKGPEDSGVPDDNNNNNGSGPDLLPLWIVLGILGAIIIIAAIIYVVRSRGAGGDGGGGAAPPSGGGGKAANPYVIL